VNTFAPYILTALINKPKRLLYITSGLHAGGDTALEDLTWQKRGDGKLSSEQAYADSKLCMVLLAKAIARRWPEVQSNSLDPGWLATKMGGPSAPGDIDAAVRMYLHLAKGDANVTGKYFGQTGEKTPHKSASYETLQDRYMSICQEVTDVRFPSL
jgi:NAD(P)-dependent dehydrogenase (short-subunit alcohol dehydrogenase family)